MNRLEKAVLQTAIIPVEEKTSSFNSSAIDISGLQDMGKLVLMVEAVSGTDPTLDIEIEHGLTSGGSFASISPSVDFVQVEDADSEQEINLYLDGLKQFIRAAVTIGGTDTPTFRLGLVLLGR